MMKMSRNIICYAVLATLALSGAFRATAVLPEHTVKRATERIVLDGILDEADWQAADSFGDFVFPWYTSGVREQTEAKMLWDDTFLYLSFVCHDAHIWADLYNTNAGVSANDAAEIFWNPDPLNQATYYQFEINCIGNLLSVWKNGANPRPTIMLPHITQYISGTVNADADTDTLWVLEVGIRFEDYPDLVKHVPVAGDMWRINLNRCGGKTNLQYSQWSPSSTKTPNFHSPDDFGKLFFSDEPVRAPSSVAEGTKAVPVAVRINGVRPNPFNPSTLVEFTIGRPGDVSVIVYDVTGRVVKRLVDRSFGAGFHSVMWDGRDGSGNDASSGVYIVKVGSSGMYASARMTLVK